MIHFGHKIREVIKEKGIKQTEVAAKINTSANNFQNIINSEDISVLRLQQLSKILDYDFFQHLDLPGKVQQVEAKKKASITLMLTVDDPQKEEKILKLVLGKDFKL